MCDSAGMRVFWGVLCLIYVLLLQAPRFILYGKKVEKYTAELVQKKLPGNNLKQLDFVPPVSEKGDLDAAKSKVTPPPKKTAQPTLGFQLDEAYFDSSTLPRKFYTIPESEIYSSRDLKQNEFLLSVLTNEQPWSSTMFLREHNDWRKKFGLYNQFTSVRRQKCRAQRMNEEVVKVMDNTYIQQQIDLALTSTPTVPPLTRRSLIRRSPAIMTLKEFFLMSTRTLTDAQLLTVIRAFNEAFDASSTTRIRTLPSPDGFLTYHFKNVCYSPSDYKVIVFDAVNQTLFDRIDVAAKSLGVAGPLKKSMLNQFGVLKNEITARTFEFNYPRYVSERLDIRTNFTFADALTQPIGPLTNLTVAFVNNRFYPNIFHGLERYGGFVDYLLHCEKYPTIDHLILDPRRSQWETEFLKAMELVIHDRSYYNVSKHGDGDMCIRDAVYLHHLQNTHPSGVMGSFENADFMRSSIYNYYNLTVKNKFGTTLIPISTVSETPMDVGSSHPFISSLTRYLKQFRLTIVQRSRNRTIMNLRLIESLLKSIFQEVLNTEVVTFDNPALTYQVQTLSHTDILMTAHGAALTNVLFMLPHSVLLEVVPASFFHNLFDKFAHACQVQYFFVADFSTAGLTPDEAAVARNLNMSGWSLDLRVLLRKNCSPNPNMVIWTMADAVMYLLAQSQSHSSIVHYSFFFN